MEFGFTTGLYTPPAKPRSAWRTMLFSIMLTLIPVVGPGISTIYVDRRDDPESFDFVRALASAVIQLVAIAALAIIVWFIVVVVLGVRVEVTRV